MRVALNVPLMAAACGAMLLGAAAHARAQSPPSPPSPSPGAEAKAVRAGFDATWKLNADESEKFSDKMQKARGTTRGGGGGGGGGFGGGRGGGFGGGRGGFGGGGRRGGGGGGGGDAGTDAAREGARETIQKLEEPAETLTIKQESEAFLIGDDSGQIRRLHPDGRAVKADDGTEVKTRWHGDELVTETTPARGPRWRDTFALAPDGRRLFVTTHFEPSWGSAFDVKRVYDLAGAP